MVSLSIEQTFDAKNAINGKKWRLLMKTSKEVMNKVAAEWAVSAIEKLEAINTRAKADINEAMGLTDGKKSFTVTLEPDTEEIARWLRWNTTLGEVVPYSQLEADIRANRISEDIARSFGLKFALAEALNDGSKQIPVFEDREAAKRHYAKKYAGMKFTKLAARFMSEEENQRFSQQWQRYAGNRTVTIHISTTVEDFIRMSHGNGWTSCHDSRKCSYSYVNGCTGLAASPSQFIAYVEAADGCLEWRVIGSFHGNGISLHKQYPNYKPAFIDGLHGHFETFMGELEPEACFSSVHDGDWYQGYNDGVYYQWVQKDMFLDDVEYGAPSICLRCGDVQRGHDLDDSMACSECLGQVYCGHCGDRVDEDDAIVYNGGFYCRHCATNYLDIVQCEDCGEWTDDYTSVQGSGFICGDCFESNYTVCSDCGEVVYNRDAYHDNGDSYCEYCHNKLIEAREAEEEAGTEE